MKRKNEKSTVKNPYANNKGGQIRAPFAGKEDEPKGQKLVGTNDLRVKK